MVVWPTTAVVDRKLIIVGLAVVVGFPMVVVVSNAFLGLAEVVCLPYVVVAVVGLIVVVCFSVAVV